MHCEESGNGHSPQGSEACSLGNFFIFTCSKINSSAFWQRIYIYKFKQYIFLPLVLNSTGV